MPTLFVGATPIGNLEDITLRAMRVLKEVSLIAAEDTRHTLKLLNACGIKTPLTSYYEHNKLTKLDYVLQKLETGDVALVSDAGTPGIADPGHELIAAAIARVVRAEGESHAVRKLSERDAFGWVREAARERRLKTVCLSGGVFQNRVLLEGVTAALEKAGFKVYSNRQVPANDGGIALGQAWYALKDFKPV